MGVLENVAGACHVVGPSEQLPLAIENGGHALERHVRRLVLQPDVDLGIELEAVDARIAEEFGNDDLIALACHRNRQSSVVLSLPPGRD